ncbi:MAG: hypothetical protein HFE78_06275 [Clostridiales bacterium]|nr:hypothetical protein [Clostridiales bacterium]
MENILNRIIDIENRAQQIVSQASEAKALLPEQIKTALQAYHEQTEKTSAQEFEAVEQRENERMAAALQTLADQCEKDKERLCRAYERHGEEWVQALYERVTGHGGL